ncbi:hypothetical protein V7139_27945 [Neobacillus drentensis]|uniref:hypothetical protein n=1 Tax=Neobacillus drentensis TaxID=220684 RepID=UPI002FFD8793
MSWILWILFVFVLMILAFALIIDLKLKKNNNNPQIPTHPNAKPGDSSNYMMGDNKDTALL